MNKNFKNIFLVAMFLSVPAVLNATFSGREGTVRLNGMGETGVGLVDDISSIYSNPAGLGEIYVTEVMAEYGQKYVGLDSEVGLSESKLGMVYRVKEGMGIGLGGWLFGAGELYKEGEFKIGAGIKLNKKLRLGGMLKIMSVSYGDTPYNEINEVFDEGTGKMGIGIEIGGKYGLTEKIDVGLAVRDLTQPDMGLKYEDKVPMDIVAGAGYRINNLTMVGLDYEQRSDKNRISLGMEKWIREFAIRGGIGIGSSKYMRLSAGFGYEGKRMGIEYGFWYPLSGIKEMYGTHHIGMGYRFGESRILKLVKEVDNSDEAQKMYLEAQMNIEKEEYGRAYEVLGRALKLDKKNEEIKMSYVKMKVVGSRIKIVTRENLLLQRSLSLGIKKYLEGDSRKSLDYLVYAYSVSEEPGIKGVIEDIEKESGISLDSEGIVLSWNLADQKVNQAMNRFRDKKYDESVKLFEEVLELEPDNITALKRMGSAYYMLNRMEQAGKVWKRALELDPKDDKIREMLNKIK